MEKGTHQRWEAEFLVLVFFNLSTSCTVGWVMDDGDSDGWPPCCFTPWRLNQNQLSTVSCKWDNQPDIHHLLIAQPLTVWFKKKKKKWRVHRGGWRGTATRRERENSTTEISEQGLILWADTKTDIKPFSHCCGDMAAMITFYYPIISFLMNELIKRQEKKLFLAIICPVRKSQKL